MFKVWRETGDKDITLRLLDDMGDVVTLVACDSEGNVLPFGSILSITRLGKLVLHSNCRVPGIVTEEDGKIAIAHDVKWEYIKPKGLKLNWIEE